MIRIRSLALAAGMAAGLAVWASAIPAWAEDRPQPSSRLDQIIASGTLRIGTTGDYKPFTALDKASGTFSGLDIDLAERLAKALGVKAVFVETSWPTLMTDFEAGRFDVGIGGISITLERQKRAFFSAPTFREGKTPIARCADAARFQTLTEIDRPEVRVVVNPGGTNERFARAHLKTAPITVFPDNNRVFDEIAAGRADVMMTDSAETRFQQKLHPGVLCAVHPDKPFDFAEKAVLLPRDEPLRLFVDQWLHIERETGAFDKLVAKYLD